jgi:AP-2 complex subunit alpha
MLKENSPEIQMMSNSIRNDLLNHNALCQSMALTLAANINNSDLLSDIAEDVLKYLSHWNEKQLHTVKKAFICLTKILKIKKEVHDASLFSKYILKIIDMKNMEVLQSLAGLVLYLITTFGYQGYVDVAMKFVNNILTRLKEVPEEYKYYHMKAPWLQIKIQKILQLIPPSEFTSEAITHIKDYISNISSKMKTTTESVVKYVRFYAEYCIFFETVNLIDHLNTKISHRIFDNFVNLLGSFLRDDHSKHPNKDVNTKYLALDSMARLSKYSSGNSIFKEHSNIIFSSLRDSDISIRRRSLDLLFLVCTTDTVKTICKELLSYFKEDEPQLKEDIALKLAILSEKYTSDLAWYVDVCIKMLEVAGDYVSEDIIFRMVQIITGFEGQEPQTQLQQYACDKIMKLLERDYVYELVVKLGALLLGDFGYLLTREGNKLLILDEYNHEIHSFEKQIECLFRHVLICSNSTKYSVFNCVMKFVATRADLRVHAIPLFEQYLEHWDPELQQRAIEYIYLSKLNSECEEIPDISDIR